MSVSVLEPDRDLIPETARFKFQCYMRATPRIYAFKCGACGKIRKDRFLKDPGWLHVRRTCDRAGSSCDEPEDNAQIEAPHYLPGSIVWANYGPMKWPAIVEYSNMDHCDFYLLRRQDEVPHQYFVSFINRCPDWAVGGWQPTTSLKPIFPSQTQDYTPNATLREAMDKVHALINETLRERLLQLSYIALEMRSEGMEVDPPAVGAYEEVGGDEEEVPTWYVVD